MLSYSLIYLLTFCLNHGHSLSSSSAGLYQSRVFCASHPARSTTFLTLPVVLDIADDALYALSTTRRSLKDGDSGDTVAAISWLTGKIASNHSFARLAPSHPYYRSLGSQPFIHSLTCCFPSCIVVVGMFGSSNRSSRSAHDAKIPCYANQ
jgi:hypothetical protein